MQAEEHGLRAKAGIDWSGVAAIEQELKGPEDEHETHQSGAGDGLHEAMTEAGLYPGLGNGFVPVTVMHAALQSKEWRDELDKIFCSYRLEQ